MAFQALLKGKLFVAVVALEWTLLRMRNDVLFIVQWIEINSLATVAVVSRNFRVHVNLLVTIQQGRSTEGSIANDAHIVLLLSVCENVLGEIVFGEESFFATVA